MPDGRANNKSDPKYDEPKVHRLNLRLTDTAYKWLLERVEEIKPADPKATIADWIEQQARK